MNVLIAGGTGFIGQALQERLRARGDAVTLVSRRPGARTVLWSDEVRLKEAVGAADVVVNLCGASVAGKRWDERYKTELRESRILPTRTLAALRPKVLVQASAVGWYGDGGERELKESAPASGDFFGKLCADWEAAAQSGPERVCCLRIGQVLGRGGGALEAMLNPPMVPLSPWKLGLGGPLGSGKQWVPWIHLGDVLEMLVAAIENERWSGPVNAVAPQPVTAGELARAIGRALGKPALIPVPAFALKLLLGEFTEFLLASQRVIPQKALALGYDYRFPTLDGALADLLSDSPSMR